MKSVVFIEKAANFSLKLLIFRDFCKCNLLIIKCLTIEFYFLSSTKKNFISTIIKAEDAQTPDSINNAIELAFDIQRHWINYQFPRYLMSLGDIANDIFRKNNLPLCDYSYFANLVECYFMSPYVIPMDEYGLPIQISNKIGRIMDISSDIDIALEQLHNFTPSQRNFSNIEREFIEEFKAYI